MESAASERSGQVPGHSAAGGAADGRIDARHRYKLLGECRELVLGRLAVIVARALARIGEALANEALALERGEGRRCRLDAVLLLRQHRRSAERHFRRHFGDLFEQRLSGRPGSSGIDAAGDARMPIPELAATVAAAVGDGRSRAAAIRLGALLEREPFDDRSHPLAAGAILQALAMALADSSPQPVEQGVSDAILTAFAPDLARELGAVHVELNAWLRARGILPQLEQAAPAAAGGSLPDRMTADRMTAELVGLVFGRVRDDGSLAASVKGQLMRLQAVAVKAALIDRSFFARPSHPMRQLIDLTTQLAADPDADLAAEGPLVRGLAAVFDKLVRDVGQTLDAFAPAIAGIERLRQEETTRRAEALASQLARAEREEASALVIDRARDDIRERIDESVPTFVRAFLLRWWTSVIARSRLDRAGTAAASGDPMLRVAEQLIWSVAPKHPEEIGRLAALLPCLIQGLVEGSKRVEMPDAERKDFMQELLAAHAGVIEAAKHWQPGQPDPRPPTMRLRSDGTIRFARPPRDSVSDPVTVTAGESVLGRFERGDHIELSRDDGVAAVYKLAWISPARKLFILSRYPQDTLSLSAAQLASLVFNERARRLDGPQAVDDAIGVLAREAVNSRKPSHGSPG